MSRIFTMLFALAVTVVSFNCHAAYFKWAFGSEFMTEDDRYYVTLTAILKDGSTKSLQPECVADDTSTHIWSLDKGVSVRFDIYSLVSESGDTLKYNNALIIGSVTVSKQELVTVESFLSIYRLKDKDAYILHYSPLPPTPVPEPSVNTLICYGLPLFLLRRKKIEG